MMSPHEAPTPGTREHFLQVTTLRRWGTIQEYVELCRARGYFTEAFYWKAMAHMERIHVRRRLKQVTNGSGWPVFGNIERVGPDGTPARVFPVYFCVPEGERVALCAPLRMTCVWRGDRSSVPGAHSARLAD